MSELIFGQWRGINNVQQPYAITRQDMVSADNVDIDNEGNVSRRSGYVVRNAGAAHSIFSAGDICLFRRGSGLYRLNADNSATQIATLSATPTCYAEYLGKVWLSDGVSTYVTDGVTVEKAGIDAPTSLSVTSPFAAGTDRFSAAITFASSTYETGAYVLDGFTGSVPLKFTMPVSADSRVKTKALYVTEKNGEVMYLAGVYQNSVENATWSGTSLSSQLVTRYKGPAPAGDLLAFHNGRLYVASGRFVYYSDPFQPNLFEQTSVIAFPSPVTMMAAVESGVAFGTTDEVLFMSGPDPIESSLTRVAGHGVYPGTAVKVRGAELMGGSSGDAYVCFTPQGICSILSDGTFSHLTQDRYKATAVRGSAGYARLARINQYVAFLF